MDSDAPIDTSTKPGTEPCSIDGTDNSAGKEISWEQVEKILTDSILPLAQADGGRIELESVDGDIITVRLLDACAGCPGAPYTIRSLLEPLLQSKLRRNLKVEYKAIAKSPVSESVEG